MKKLIIILVCFISMAANAQQKQLQLSETELKSAQVQIRKAVDNLAGYIVRLGNSEVAGGATPQEKATILKWVKRSFYEFSYRNVTIQNHGQLRTLKAETYFYNLASQGSKSDGFLRVYKVEADEYYLSHKLLNPNSYKLISAKNNIRLFKVSVPITQVFLKTSSQYSPEKNSNNNTVIDKDKKFFDLFILLDDEDNLLCKLGNIRIQTNK